MLVQVSKQSEKRIQSTDRNFKQSTGTALLILKRTGKSMKTSVSKPHLTLQMRMVVFQGLLNCINDEIARKLIPQEVIVCWR